MRFLINSIKAFHYVGIALFFASIYAMIFHHLGYALFVVVAYAICCGTKKEYEEMEQEVRDTIAELQDNIKAFCKEDEVLGTHEVEFPIGDKIYIVKFYHHVEYKQIIGASHMGDYETLYEVTDEYITILDITCLDRFDEIWDMGFTLDQLQEGL